MPKKTTTDLILGAADAIECREGLIYDVANEHAQIVGNVAHMRWFKLAVAEELTTRHKCWAHLAEEIRKME